VGAWEDYLAAAQRLDDVRRAAAAAAAEQTAALTAARQELSGVRQRLTLQRARLTDLAARAGLPALSLVPGPPVADPPTPAAASALLRAARADLDAADATLSQVDTGTVTRGPFPDWPQPMRNLLVYGGAAFLVLFAQLVLYFAVSGPASSVLALLCGATLPAIGYGVSWLTVGLLYGKVERNPIMGAAISAAPVVLLCAGISASAMLR
jgi:hypothetical protein